MMDKDKLLKVGIITSAHGIKGEVNVFPTTDDIKRFKKLKDVILDTGKELKEMTVLGARFNKQSVILKIKDIDDRNAAELLRKKELLVTRENAVRLSRDEYFVADLIGLSVRDEDGVPIGVLSDVISTGANDVYEIRIDEDYEYPGVKIMPEVFYAPAIKECVKNVDIESGVVTIHIMPGLI